MGYDADGILAFGFELTEDEVYDLREQWDDYDGEDEEWVAEKFGLPRPVVGYSAETRELFSEYWATKRKLMQNIGIELTRTGWCEEPGYIVAVKQASAYASYGDVLEIDFDSLSEAAETGKRKLREWCDTVGVEYREPKWLLSNHLSV